MTVKIVREPNEILWASSLLRQTKELVEIEINDTDFQSKPPLVVRITVH